MFHITASWPFKDLEKKTGIRMNIFQVYLLVLQRKKDKIWNYDLKSNLALD